MGNIGLIKYCVGQQDDLETLPVTAIQISDDFKYFQNENWYRFQSKRLFDPNKFIFLYKNYQDTQQILHQLWQIVDWKHCSYYNKHQADYLVISQQWKYAIRRGVPIENFKNLIEIMFHDVLVPNNSLLKYEHEAQKFHLSNKRHSKNQVSQGKLFVNVSNFILNKHGKKALERILLMLEQSQGQLKYNPYLANFIQLFLIFIDQASVYVIIAHLIKKSFGVSIKRKQSLRWHFTLNHQQLQKLAVKFYETVSKISPTVLSLKKHFQKQKIDHMEIFQQIVGNFYAGYLPFEIIIKIFMEFVNEGVRVLFRFFYAVLKISSIKIFQSQYANQTLRIIKNKLLTFFNEGENSRLFFRLAFDLYLDSYYMNKIKQIEHQLKIQQKHQKIYYLPNIVGTSIILSREDLNDLWAFIPIKINHYDIKRIYSSQNQANLQSMINSLYEHDLTIILIQSLNDHVFGVFFASKLEKEQQLKKQWFSSLKSKKNYSMGILMKNDENQTQKLALEKSLKSNKTANKFQLPQNNDLPYFGSSQSFVFKLKPDLIKYHSTGQNIFYCKYNDNFLIIGGPQASPALKIQSSLKKGYSYCSPTYANKALHSQNEGSFDIKLIECFCLF